MEDARVLAQKGGLNPDKWQDVRQVLPRLAEPEAFQQLKHGYARGGEAAQLVDNVRNYYDILARMHPRDASLPGPAVAEGDQLSTKGRRGQVIGLVPRLERPGVGVEGHGVVRSVADGHAVRVGHGMSWTMR
jgi:hypothetical protein